MESLEKLQAGVVALYELHLEFPTVTVTNGFLLEIEKNEALLAILSDEHRNFVEKSIEEFNAKTERGLRASKEQSRALIKAEEIQVELEKQKNIAEQAQALAEENESKATRQRDSVMAELEAANQYQMQTDRQRRQFVTAQAHGYPAWSLLFVFVIGIFILNWFEKPGVDVLVPVLAGVLGALFQSYSGAFSSLFTPLVREEQKPAKKKLEADREQ